MQRSTLVLLALAAATASGDLLAQSNARNTGAVPLSSGYNGALENIGQLTGFSASSCQRYYGRRGGAFPGGEIGIAFLNQLCNPGGFDLSWFAPMSEDHPKFGFLVAREVNGRLVQISDWSYCKHAFLSLNDPGTCGNCVNTVSGSQMHVGCSDVYTTGNNGDRNYLGPPSEINPWLGTWNHTGSYFDIGDPSQVGYPLPADGTKSLNVGAFDAVKNRVTIRESELGGTVTSGLYFQIHVIHEGEPIENRWNNTMSRPFSLTWSGTTWSIASSGTATHGSILTRWTGSTLAIGQNGGGAWNNTDDGRFAVAVKVTGPTNGIWHYEYVVHNLDNNRGSSAFRLPVCTSARVTNIGFRDIDSDPLNNWTPTVSGGEIAWTAPLSNPQKWNTLFNFWFDSDAAPISGSATLDEAAVGPGALTVSVPTSVPGYVPIVYLGDGCGTPAFDLSGTGGFPTGGNPAFGLRLTSTPSTGFMVLFSNPIAGGTIVPGCDLFIDLGGFGDLGFWFTDGAGVATLTTGVDPSWGDVNLQALTFVPSPPILGLVGLSNGIKVRFNGTGCN